MKFIKSKAGFTLIELLIVVGILAVLAAIAIPTVAGLIDRANASADNTNVNEMTNAIERFTSEYEMYCQDLANGTLDFNNLDALQNRVYNVTKIKTREDITKIEAAGINYCIRINRETKYPENVATIAAIAQNYTKTTSSQFEPKQSDCHYFYSPDCGIIVCADSENATVETLNKMVVSGRDAKGNPLSNKTIWIDITKNTILSLTHKGVIPEGAKYITASGNIYYPGDNFPASIKTNDKYFYGDYYYLKSGDSAGWMIKINTEVTTLNETSYGEILNSINGLTVRSAYKTFENCINLTTPPDLPDTIRAMNATFRNCKSLVDLSNYKMPSDLRQMGRSAGEGTFDGCTKLEYSPQIPDTTVHMYETFKNCKALVEEPTIPDIFDKTITFKGCTQFGY